MTPFLYDSALRENKRNLTKWIRVMVGFGIIWLLVVSVGTLFAKDYQLNNGDIIGDEDVMWTVPAIGSCAEAFIDRMRETACLKEVVEKMLEDKIICEVEGHRWELGCGLDGCATIHEGPTRHCVICGEMQSRSLGDWK